MGDLYSKLKAYSESDYYPYHMPGHKRCLYGDAMADAEKMDITEIDGFDNLHCATGIIKKLQEKAAAFYGAKESYYLVNGSTAGILSAISATVPEGASILIARGSHKAVYHSVYLRKLSAQYLFEDMDEEFHCALPVTVTQVEQALIQNPDVSAVLIVSPTYEGLVADVAAIQEVVHRRGIPLIVDSAHGAHLGFHLAWPENSAALGADLVIESLHKTLPAPTQTAILHVSGNLVNTKKLKRFLQIYQTSSPSYLFMAAMEEALDMVFQKKDMLFESFLKNWTEMLAVLGECKNIRILQRSGSDIGKLVVRDASGCLSGKQIYEELLERYHLQLEMATQEYALAMFTVADGEEAYRRMTEALLEIDNFCEREKERKAKEIKHSYCFQRIYPKVVQTLVQSWDSEIQDIPLSLAKGCVSGDFINLYPPGIPIVVPGEELTEEICTYLQQLTDSGLTVHGIQKKDNDIVVKVVHENK